MAEEESRGTARSWAATWAWLSRQGAIGVSSPRVQALEVEAPMEEGQGGAGTGWLSASPQTAPALAPETGEKEGV